MNCSVCGGQLNTLGTLGNMEHLRCRDCGMEFSQEHVKGPRHYVVMGGISGCMPSHYDVFERKADALDYIRLMYDDVHLPAWTDGPAVVDGRYENRYMDVVREVRDYGIAYNVGCGDPQYDLSYVSCDPCDCEGIWKHETGEY